MKSLHQRRRITFAELGALYGTLGMLQAGELTYHEAPASYETLPRGSKHLFNMRVSCRIEGCGSIGCIGGAMAMIMGLDADKAVDYVGGGITQHGDHSPALSLLFFPPDDMDWDDIKPRHAIKAIKNFLDYGKPLWAQVMKGR